MFLNLGLCAACWAHFMCHHKMWPTSVSHPFSSLNSCLGFAGGKHYQKIAIPVFKFCYFRLLSFYSVPKNFNDSSDICLMGFIHSIQICEIFRQTFGPSHRKCPMIFMNSAHILFYRYLFSLLSWGWFVIAVCGSISLRQVVKYWRNCERM